MGFDYNQGGQVVHYTTSTGQAHAARQHTNSILSMNFGKIAAENELGDEQRFVSTYADLWHILEKVEKREAALILGPKGTGKTAAAQYLKLSWEKRLGAEKVFCETVDFDDLNRTASPLYSLTSKEISDESPHTTDVAWKLFIGLRLFKSLISDPSSALAQDPQAHSLYKRLGELGYTVSDYPKVLRTVRRAKHTVQIPTIWKTEISSEDGQLSLDDFSEALLRICMKCTTPNRHLLIIDGLDKTVRDTASYWLTISSLLRVNDKIRSLASTMLSSVYTLVLCRDDIFRKLLMPDGNKIKSDGSILLDWHPEESNSSETLLWDYLAMKTGVGIDELFLHLPNAVAVKGKQIRTQDFLLQMTRYTPRDLAALFLQIQRDVRSNRPIDSNLVRSSARSYSANYFMDEVTTEAVGLLPKKVVIELPELFFTLGKRVVYPSDFERALSELELSEDLSVRDLVNYLYLQGAIGNYDQRTGYMNFYHRNRLTGFSRRGPWVLHTAIIYAANISWN